MFNLTRKLPNCSSPRLYWFTSLQQRVRALNCSPPSLHLLVLLILVGVYCYCCGFNLRFLITNDAEHLSSAYYTLFTLWKRAEQQWSQQVCRYLSRMEAAGKSSGCPGLMVGVSSPAEKDFFKTSFWPCHAACVILVPQPGIEPRPLAVKVWSPDHRTAKEFLGRTSCANNFRLDAYSFQVGNI